MAIGQAWKNGMFSCGVADHKLVLLPSPAYSTASFYCNVCREPGYTENYHCQACEFDLHPSCAIAFEPILDCGDPQHTLALMAKPPYPSGQYKCSLCGYDGSEQVYNCSVCEFDLHPDCAPIKEEITGEAWGHPLDHPLMRLRTPSTLPSKICYCCRQPLLEGQWIYRCTAAGCVHQLHAWCALRSAPLKRLHIQKFGNPHGADNATLLLQQQLNQLELQRQQQTMLAQFQKRCIDSADITTTRKQDPEWRRRHGYF